MNLFNRLYNALKYRVLKLYLWLEFRFFQLFGVSHKFFPIKRGEIFLPLSPLYKDNRRRFEAREPYTDDVLKKYLKPDMVVLEIGASLGYFTLLISQLLGKNGKCYSFEPFPKYAYCLKKTLEKNKLNNVVHVPLAVGDKPGEISFSDEDDSSYSGIASLWNFNPKRKLADAKNNTSKTNVEVVKISDFLKRENIKADVLFMDIEGCETLVFSDIFESFPKDELPLIYFESHQGLYGMEVLESLLSESKKIGYDVEKVTKQHFVLIPKQTTNSTLSKLANEVSNI